MFNILSYLGEKFNESNIIWGVGASILLNQFGLIENPKDIDIFVDIKDIDRVDEILKSIGKKKQWEETAIYSTKYFYEYMVDGIDVDVMSRFAVKLIIVVGYLNMSLIINLFQNLKWLMELRFLFFFRGLVCYLSTNS